MSAPSQQFFQLIKQGSSQLETLCALSDAEKAAIEAHSAEQLQSVVDKKRQVLSDFADNVNARNQILVAQGLSPDTQGFEGFLAGLPPPQRELIGKSWQALEARLKQAAALNERNERIVMRSQKNLDQLLRIIRGQDAKTSIYSSAGLRNYSPQNTLGKA